MGLSVSVGVLVRADPEYREHFARQVVEINRVLKANGLPPHAEPTSLAKKRRQRHGLGGFPYSWLHYLRRAVAYDRGGSAEDFRPVARGEDPAEDAMIEEEMCMLSSHLLCHSDCEGFYVPADFPDPLFDEKKGRLEGGGMLGSSQRALAEVLAAAPLLGIPFRAGKPTDATLKAIAEEPDTGPYWIERKVWVTMYEAFRDSVEHGCAVVFG